MLSWINKLLVISFVSFTIFICATLGFLPFISQELETFLFVLAILGFIFGILLSVIEALKELEKKTKVRFLAILVFTVSLLVAIGLVNNPSLSPPLVYSTPTPTQSPPSKDTLAYAVIRTETESDGTTKDIVDLSINSIGLGKLLLTSPKEMNLGDTGIVRLSITPDSAISFPSTGSIPTQNTNNALLAFQFTDRIDIFPIMKADLTGAGFEITSNGLSEKVILSNKTTEWIWTIKPQDEGIHILLVQISIPVIIDGYEKNLDTPLKNIPVEIRVKKSLQRKVDDLKSLILPSLISLFGVLLGLYANYRVKERDKTISELEKKLFQDTSEKEKLINEISRLRKIPKWKFWQK